MVLIGAWYKLSIAVCVRKVNHNMIYQKRIRKGIWSLWKGCRTLQIRESIYDGLLNSVELLCFASCNLFWLGLGRSKKEAVADNNMRYIDNADRVEIERLYSLPRGVMDLAGS